MHTQTKKLIRGFTIIEVLIVLAIAGLIMAIIFLAVPALQRNSRNSAIRSDAAAVLAAVNDYVANNQGALPTAPTTAQTGPLICFGAAASGGACPSGTTEAKVSGGTSVTLNPAAAGMPTTTGTIYIRTNTKCSSNNFGTTGGAPRAVAAGFLVESSSSQTASQCIES